MVTETENARKMMSGGTVDDWLDDLLPAPDPIAPKPTEPATPHPDEGTGGSNTPPPEIHETSPAPEPMPSNPPGTEPPPYEGDTGDSDDSGDSGGDQGGSAPQPEDSKQGGYFIGELTDDPDPEETGPEYTWETGVPGEGTMVLTGRKKVEQEPVTEQPDPPPSPELVENYWLKGGLLVAIAIIVCLLFQNPRRKKS